MFDFEALSHAIASRTVLCVGDLMLDEFIYGEVSRISPEAPAPVIAVQRSETNVGGAGCRSRPADNAKSAFRLRAFFDPYAARRLGTGADGGARHRAKADRRHPAATRPRRHLSL